MGEVVTEDEELTLSFENFVVLTWLRLIHADLPKLIKQRYGTELRSRTLASIKPEISQALDSLLDELQASDDAQAMRAAVSELPRSKQTLPARPRKSCPLCKCAGRPDNHFLSKCTFLPHQDKMFMAKSRQVVGEQAEMDDDAGECSSEETAPSSGVKRVLIKQSPYLDAFHGHCPVRLTIDSGATGNMIKASCATRLGITVTGSTQSAFQVDGSSLLEVVGETRTRFQRDGHSLYFEGLVVENLNFDIVAGIPFMEKNDVSIRPAKRQICLNEDVYSYGSLQTPMDKHAMRRVHVLRAQDKCTVWPGDYIELELPPELCDVDCELAIEPHMDTSRDQSDSHQWPAPTSLRSVSGKIRIPNLTGEPWLVQRSDHLCCVHATYAPSPTDAAAPANPPKPAAKVNSALSSDHVALDPDNVMPPDIKDKLCALHREFDGVFDPHFKGYNGAVGPFRAKVNMGPVLPPQRKGRVPQYSRGQLQELWAQFDALEDMGVFRRPEDVDITVEYVNPSFLIKKPDGDFRLVTAFADVGRYSKPQPSLMPDVDSTLRLIAQWKYIIATDLTKAFYQIPLSRDSWKYCGVVTPFKGVRVYVPSAMGMPGSETALEEFTCRVFGDLLEQGHVAKVADDLYCGADTLENLLAVWRRVLSALQHCGLNLSATKTTVAPVQTSILGWRQGTLALPRPADQLWIVTDSTVRVPGLGATLYITCKDTVRVAGYFSAKLRWNQSSWL